VNFLVDSQLPPALARWIAGQGHKVAHVFELGLESADDGVVWERARNERAIIISKDEDFADLWSLRGEGVALVWVRKGNCSNRALITWLEPLWPEVLRRLGQGERFIELRA
jgi:predicted nuclease of predicted toxin-antitoxin system